MAGEHELQRVVDDLVRLHGEIDFKVDAARRTIGFARTFKHPLDFYHRKGLITDEQHSAGVDLAQAFHFGIEVGNHSQWRYEPASSGGGPEADKALVQLVKAQAYFRAVLAVDGRATQKVVVGVCCFGEKAGKGGGMDVLKRGLDDLVKHYRKRARKAG